MRVFVLVAVGAIIVVAGCSATTPPPREDISPPTPFFIIKSRAEATESEVRALIVKIGADAKLDTLGIAAASEKKVNSEVNASSEFESISSSARAQWGEKKARNIVSLEDTLLHVSQQVSLGDSVAARDSVFAVTKGNIK